MKANALTSFALLVGTPSSCFGFYMLSLRHLELPGRRRRTLS